MVDLVEHILRESGTARSDFVHPINQKPGDPIAYFEDVGDRVRYQH